MFTGLITDLGEVSDIVSGEGGVRMTITTAYDTGSIAEGASIACNGCCLTALDLKPGQFSVDVSHETLDRTTLGEWQAGRRINLERSLKLGDELGGHLVSGHVDCVAHISGVRPDGESLRYDIKLPKDFARFVAEKGSVGIDGVSLTVNGVTEDSFDVNIIPHTQQVTTFGRLQEGDAVNIEIDMLARYVARLLNKS